MKIKISIIISISIIILVMLFWKYLPVDFIKNIRANNLNKDANKIIVQMYKNQSSPESIETGIQLLNEAIELDSQNITYISNLLKFYYFKKDYENSIKYLDKLVSIKPNDANIYLNRGLVFEVIRDTIKAKNDFSKSLHLTDIMSKRNLSESERITSIKIYQHFKKYKEATRELVKLRTAYPESLYYEILAKEMPDSNKKYLEALNSEI